MAGLLRRDQKRALTLSGLGFLIIFVIISYVHQDVSPSYLLDWNSSRKPDSSSHITIRPGHDDFGFNNTPTSDPIERPSSNFPSDYVEPLSTGRARIVPTNKETTIPSTPLESDPSVVVPAQVHGFSVFDNLYVRNGTFFVLTDDQKSFPEQVDIMSGIGPLWLDMGIDIADQFFKFIPTSKAKEILGDHATVVPHTTIFLADIPQFLPHFYHFWGEVILGAWRVYTTFALSKSGAVDQLPFPARWVMPFVLKDEDWRDRAGLNGPLMRLAWPDAFIEQGDLWRDWKKMGTTLVFERGMIVNRKSAHNAPSGRHYGKMIGGAMNVTVPKNYWEPVRKSVVENLFAYVPKVDSSGKPLSRPFFEATLVPSGDDDTTTSKPLKPVVTYISRQSTGRRLVKEDHERLVAALEELEREGICTVRIPVMERLTLKEQLAETTSSTIMLGVHGNGLTHQLFMPPSLRSTVIEMVVPDSYIFDYEMLARNMGHKHYLIGNDTITSYPPGQNPENVHIPDGSAFHGDAIPVVGQIVADLIRLRLTQPENEVEL